MSDSLCETIQLAKHGNQTATVSLLHRFKPLLCGCAKRYQGSCHYEDAYQESCTAFLEAIYEWQPEFGIPFPAFARAKVRGDVKSAMRRIWRYDDRKLIPFLCGDGEEPVNELWDEAETWKMGEADNELRIYLSHLMSLAKLSKREAIYLQWFIEGRKPAEMAVRMGVSTETVKTWRKRSLKKLRAVVKQEAKSMAGTVFA